MPGQTKITSTIAEYASRKPKTRPICVTTGAERVLHRVQPDDPPLGQALGARRRDVVLAEHLEHASSAPAARRAPASREGERERGQDEVLEAAVAERRQQVAA